MTTGNLFDASSSALGYLYQCRYALLLLIERSTRNPALAMSIERFDDVAFEEKGTSRELIQTKHHVGQPRNLTDASADLWKTLRIWSEGVLSGTIDLEDVILVIVSTAAAPEGSIASLLRGDGRDEAKALERLVQIATSSVNKDNAAAYAKFRQLSNAQQKALIGSAYVLDGAPDVTDVLPEIKSGLAYAAPLQRLDDLVTALEGWWFDTVVRHLKAQDGGTISGQALHTKLDDLREQFRRDSLPLDFCFVELPELPSPAGDQRIFVKQLRIIECNEVT